MRKMVPWVGAAIILFIVFGTMYVVIQQYQRANADSPQIQMAEDAEVALNQNATPASLTVGKVDMNTSLAPFIIIYNKLGQVVSGTGYLNGKIPTAPFGILTDANNHQYHRVTWEPQSNARFAAVTVSANKYYVLSGRSIKEIEKNTNQSLQIAFAGGILSLIVLMITMVLYRPKLTEKS